MTLLRTNPISSSLFTVCAKSKELVIEMSLLSHSTKLSRLYDDACDVGFSIKSEKTGNVSSWYLAEEKRNADGELEAMVFLPIEEDVRKNSNLSGWKVTAFND